MTAKISQYVVPRRSANQTGRFTRSRQAWARQKFVCPGREKGSVRSNTLALIFSLIVMLSVAGLGFFYLEQVLGTASQGVNIQQLEERIVELKEKQKEVELEGARLRSMDNIEEKVRELNLVSTAQVAFLEGVTGEKVAALGE